MELCEKKSWCPLVLCLIHILYTMFHRITWCLHLSSTTLRYSWYNWLVVAIRAEQACQYILAMPTSTTDHLLMKWSSVLSSYKCSGVFTGKWCFRHQSSAAFITLSVVTCVCSSISHVTIHFTSNVIIHIIIISFTVAGIYSDLSIGNIFPSVTTTNFSTTLTTRGFLTYNNYVHDYIWTTAVCGTFNGRGKLGCVVLA